MIRKILPSRVAAVLGCAAVVALMGLSVTLARAGVPGPQSQDATADQQVARAYAQLERALAQARVGAPAGQLAQRRLAVQKALQSAHLQEIQERMRESQEEGYRRLRVRAPRVEILRDGFKWRGRDSVDAVLAQSEELELSDEQQTRIRDAQRAARRAEIARDADIEVAELDLEDLMEDQYTADLDAVEAKMREVANLRVSGRLAELRLRRDVHTILTPEQREKLEDDDNVWYFRSGDGPAAFMFGDDDGFFFEPHEMLKSFRFDGDFPLGVFKFKGRKDLDREHEAPGDEGHEGVSGRQQPDSGKHKGVKT